MERILVIEDDDLVRDALQALLEDRGYQVETASNGKIGIKTYCDKPADLVITDIIMPEQSGIETILMLRKNYPDVKIIALSGGGRTETHDYLYTAEYLGALHTFSKPVYVHALLNTVQELLNENRPY